MPTTFVVQLLEAFCKYVSYDHSSEEHKATVTMAFIDQDSRYIRKNFQRLEGLQGKLLRDFMQVTEKVYHNREIEEKEQRKREREKR